MKFIYNLFTYLQIHPPVPDEIGSMGILPFIDPAISGHKDFGALVTRIINFVLGFTGLVALVMFIVGGFWILTAGGNEEQAGKGKKTLGYALAGIIVILLSYAIVNTVIRGLEGEPITGGLPPFF